MPRATNKYPYEGKVWGGLVDLALQLTGKSEEGSGFAAILSRDGCVLSVFCEREFPDFRERIDNADASLFYDPFEGPEYQYISWSNVSRETLERILNVTFLPEDLIGFKCDPLDEIPSTHGVMF